MALASGASIANHRSIATVDPAVVATRGGGRFLLAVAAVLAILALLGLARRSPARSPADPLVRQAFDRGLDSLADALDQLGQAVQQHERQSAVARFREARRSYKRIEPLLQAYGPIVVEALNGPAAEPSEDKPYLPLGAPAGFQVVEAALFAGEDPGRDSLAATLRGMRRAVTGLRALMPRLGISDADLLDALRLEIARVVTLGVAGFDAPRSGDAVIESADALDGSRALVAAAARRNHAVRWGPVDSALGRAAEYLRAHPGFDSFDRLAFIVELANPAARAVAAARRMLPPPPLLRRAWRQTAATVFEENAIDPSAYAPVEAPAASASLVELGRRLFAEPALSGPGTRSCVFCHDPRHAFTDGRRSAALLTATTGPHRNTPTLLYSAYQPSLFADLRAPSLEMQAGMVLASPAEMGGSAELAAARLQGDASYRAAFAAAFPGRDDRAVTGPAVRAALAAYVRSLGTLDSRFDRATRGDTGALAPVERRGFTLFMGKARCGTCHFLPLFNGTLPPEFVASEPEVIGVPDRLDRTRPRLDRDPGVAGVDQQPVHFGAFKTPTLRNVALTAPYMHNGAFATLEDVIDFYDAGGGAGHGLDVPDQTLPADSLHLSAGEKQALVAFLTTLTDTAVAGPSAGRAIISSAGNPPTR